MQAWHGAAVQEAQAKLQLAVASSGSPTQPCHKSASILAPQAAVAVREAPGSSNLKDIALLKDGDTFGELALLVSLLLPHTACTA
jgi:dihydroxyacid dehydratase/phosphogluconate dehydratase